MARSFTIRSVVLLSLLLLTAVSLFAQQTGSVSGKVTATDGAALPGVTVEAKSNVLPQPRVTVTSETGEYRLPQLQPGNYSISYTLAGLQTATRRVSVILDQNHVVDVSLGLAGLAEMITVTAESTLVDRESAAIGSGLANEQIQALPVAQEYRDLQKLIPGVQISQETVRGPSGGGSGQDNVYLFDGVNVTMPLFGVQVAEPATHDIAQFSVQKGGAKAVDFGRAAGFSVDSVSKSGTNEFSGQIGYQVMNNSFIADQESTVDARFQQDRAWTTLNLGGPVLRDQLFFYGSYYQPDYSKDNQSSNYGELPDFTLDRREYFGKLTYTPTALWLINGSYRDSHRDETGSEYADNQAGTIGLGYETELKIATLEGSWILNPTSFATFKFTDFRNPGGGRPDNLVSGTIALAKGTQLPLDTLDEWGLLRVPTPSATNAAQAAFVAPFIERYGFGPSGSRTGGGTVGFSSLAVDDDDFYRKSGQLGFDWTLGSDISHNLHFGYQRYIDEEDRFQQSNGWGVITIPGGATNCPAAACGTATPAFFQAQFQQQGAGLPPIHSEYHSQSIEVNDTIKLNHWTFSVGVLASNDIYYGQGLREADNIAGLVTARGNKYKMHEIGFGDMIQPRLSATWAYNGSDTVYASYAKYNPALSSLPRAASWDRNLQRLINAYFDSTGKLIGTDAVRSSSGKLFVDGLDPRYTDEYLIGTGQQFTNRWSGRMYARYRYSTNFWEDTDNTARIDYGAGIPGVEQKPYIENLDELLDAIGSGSTYVIAELDGAFTKYYEATLESDWQGGNTFLRGSYTWSHYYGNFDQDNSTFNTNNDAAIFVGSSNIADGPGRQLWNNRYGDLRGDRRHVLKVFGTQQLPWHASFGAFAVYQSGQPYQLESYIPYKNLKFINTSDTNRYAEPAGRRKSPAHHQMDLNYTQNFALPWGGLNLQFLVDVFNVYDKQTGYDFETRVGTIGTQALTDGQCTGFSTGLDGELGCLKRAPYAKSFFDPRRFQLALRLQF
jgi:hypothetical protein